MPLTPQGLTVLNKRYFLRDDHGEVIEDVDKMFWRVALAIAKAEMNYPSMQQGNRDYWAGQFFGIMKSLDFLPNSPCLANAGKPNGQLSGCFVLPVEDSMEGIFDAVKWAALIHKTGGGTGFSFNRLRPAGSLVVGTGHLASGPVSFMRVFDAATGSVVQGGMRRGANMGILNVDHPDIVDFIHCKDKGGIENFNISVGITDQFMVSLTLCGKGVHDWKYGPNLCAHELWLEIAKSAWKTGDPGLWFIDRVNAGRGNAVPSIGPIESPNPCGEQELPPFGVCTLGSINLGNFVLKDKSAHHVERIDWRRMKDVITTAVRLLDNVVDVNHYPLPQIEKVALGERRIGFGVMGWADLLIQLELPYDSEDAVELGRFTSRMIRDMADNASINLGKERGTFPLFNDSIYASSGNHYRNAARTTIAPTGTISLIAGASSGIEPLFALSYEHSGLEGSLKGGQILNPFYDAWCKERMEKGYDLHGTDLPAWFKTALEIDPHWHVKHQAAWQENVDNAVSKTINLKETASIDTIMNVYQQAWDTGCKGITVFRTNCREQQVLNVIDTSTRNDRPGSQAISQGVTEGTISSNVSLGSTRRDSHEDDVPEVERHGNGNRGTSTRPEVLPSQTFRQSTPFGNLYVTITEKDNHPYELFATIGKAGSDVQAMAEALGRTVSVVLRSSKNGYGKDFLSDLSHQWERIGGSVSHGFGEGRTTSIPDALSKVVRRYLDGTSDIQRVCSVDSHIEPLALHNSPTKGPSMICPDCNDLSLAHEAGCQNCYSCGYSRC